MLLRFSGSSGRNENCRERFLLKHLPFSKESWSKQGMAFFESYLLLKSELFALTFALKLKPPTALRPMFLSASYLMSTDFIYLGQCHVQSLQNCVFLWSDVLRSATLVSAQLLCCFGTCTWGILNITNKVKHFSVHLIINSTLIIDHICINFILLGIAIFGDCSSQSRLWETVWMSGHLFLYTCHICNKFFNAIGNA